MTFSNFKKFDWLLFGLVIVLACISLVSLASIDSFYFSRQVIWYGIAFLLIIFGSQIKWHWLITQGWFCRGFYWLSVALLIVPFIQPGLIRKTDSWIVLGNLQFEPVELFKIGLIIILASFFSRKYLAAWQSKHIFTSLLYTLVPAGIVIYQPDMGSAIVIIGIWLGFLLMSGINKKRFFVGLFLILLILVFMWTSILRPYQKERILGFVSPEVDPLGVNYNIIQSKIAIGSAGFFGKGFKNGTQVQFDFLPEPHTDFLLAAFVEEWGFLGGLVLMLTYLGLVFRIITIGLNLRRNDLKFIVLGAGLVFLIHFFVNIGSNLGIIPVIGIGLPFVSYGGSSLLTSALLLAMIERIKIESSY